jgi:NAD(P)-dependent dehydrogenase (short-subunit alcohol dehydrogenase family)
MSKKIVLTGCTKGLGRALVDEFIALGHTVIGCGRNPEAILDLRFAIPAPSTFDVLDVAEAKKVELWAERMLTQHGAPDLVINNAGLLTPPAPLWRQNAADVAKLFQVNLSGVVHVVQGFAPAMIERGSGVIVNLSSGWGRSVSGEFAPYCASKWGLIGFTKALAEEVKREGVVVTAVCPGSVDTEMLKGSGYAPDMTPDDVAAVVEFLVHAPAAVAGCALEIFG